MTPDPAYLADVSRAMLSAVSEAQELVSRGETGAALAEVVRHARELHDILVDELAQDSDGPPVYSDEMLMEMGARLRTLEQYLRAH